MMAINVYNDAYYIIKYTKFKINIQHNNSPVVSDELGTQVLLLLAHTHT